MECHPVAAAFRRLQAIHCGGGYVTMMGLRVVLGMFEAHAFEHVKHDPKGTQRTLVTPSGYSAKL